METLEKPVAAAIWRPDRRMDWQEKSVESATINGKVWRVWERVWYGEKEFLAGQKRGKVCLSPCRHTTREVAKAWCEQQAKDGH